MSKTAAIPYTDLPLSKKLKTELQAIAIAMGEDEKQSVKDLRKSIQKYLHDHPEAADNPKFLPLFVHRTAPKAGGRNSADKATEDAAQVPAKELTGAHKTLLDRKIPVNPPAKFANLSIHKKDDAVPEESDHGSDSSSLEPTSRPASPTPEAPSEQVKPKEKKVDGAVTIALPETVQVNFYDEGDHTAVPRQVPVLTKEIPISVSTTADGTTHYATSLSKILPVAFENDSPMKGLGGRIYRLPTRGGGGGHHHIGRIDAIVQGDCRTLKIGEMDGYALRSSSEGSLHCDVFWERSTTAKVIDNSLPSFPLPSHARPKFSGAGTDIPLAIATDRAIHNPTGKIAAPGVREAFLQFLYSQITATITDAPVFGTPWPRAKRAGMLLLRQPFEDKVFKMFVAWSRPTGGYIVPKGHEEYTGVIFTKEDLFETIKIKSSRSSTSTVVFSPQSMVGSSKARAWYESGGVTHNEAFSRMTPAQFKRYLKDRAELKERARSTEAKGRRHSLSPVAGPSRKRGRAASTSESESERDSHDKKKSSKKIRVSSEDLDHY
ncbi:hypothetical protein K438DRAFT_2025241 [Mycena galopus ATCC 62051]|nr:hypothetical protein K438DRAFT_2025241 [Mycena galopus ATCC 62051]